MKNKIKKPLIVLMSCFAAILIVTALFFLYIFESGKGTQLCQDMCQNGWEHYITYPMLSAELKDIVSEEEFSDSSSDGRLKMYRKLENLVLDERPANSFSGSTRWWKTPCMDIVEADGSRFYVEFGIDVTYAFGVMRVHNFTCYIHEEKT